MRFLSLVIVLALAAGAYSNCGCLKCNKNLHVLPSPGLPYKIIYKGSPCSCPTGLPYSIQVPVQSSSNAGFRCYGYQVQPQRLLDPAAPCPVPQDYNVQVQVPVNSDPTQYYSGLQTSLDRVLITGPSDSVPAGCPQALIEPIQIGDSRDNSDFYYYPGSGLGSGSGLGRGSQNSDCGCFRYDQNIINTNVKLVPRVNPGTVRIYRKIFCPFKLDTSDLTPNRPYRQVLFKPRLGRINSDLSHGNIQNFGYVRNKNSFGFNSDSVRNFNLEEADDSGNNIQNSDLIRRSAQIEPERYNSDTKPKPNLGRMLVIGVKNKPVANQNSDPKIVRNNFSQNIQNFLQGIPNPSEKFPRTWKALQALNSSKIKVRNLAENKNMSENCIEKPVLVISVSDGDRERYFVPKEVLERFPDSRQNPVEAKKQSQKNLGPKTIFFSMSHRFTTNLNPSIETNDDSNLSKPNLPFGLFKNSDESDDESNFGQNEQNLIEDESKNEERLRRSINMRLLALKPENPSIYQRRHMADSSQNPKAPMLQSRAREAYKRAQKRNRHHKSKPRFPRHNKNKNAMQKKKNHMKHKAWWKKTNKIIKDWFFNDKIVRAPQAQIPNDAWWMQNSQPTRLKRGLKERNLPLFPFFDEDEDNEVKAPKKRRKIERNEAVSSSRASDPFLSPFNFEHMFHHTPLFHLLNAPIRCLNHVNNFKSHVRPVVNTIPKVIQVSRRYVIDLLRNFGRNVIQLGAHFVKNFAGVKKGGILNRKRHRRNAKSETFDENDYKILEQVLSILNEQNLQTEDFSERRRKKRDVNQEQPLDKSNDILQKILEILTPKSDHDFEESYEDLNSHRRKRDVEQHNDTLMQLFQALLSQSGHQNVQRSKRSSEDLVEISRLWRNGNQKLLTQTCLPGMDCYVNRRKKRQTELENKDSNIDKEDLQQFLGSLEKVEALSKRFLRSLEEAKSLLEPNDARAKFLNSNEERKKRSVEEGPKSMIDILEQVISSSGTDVVLKNIFEDDENLSFNRYETLRPKRHTLIQVPQRSRIKRQVETTEKDSTPTPKESIQEYKVIDIEDRHKDEQFEPKTDIKHYSNHQEENRNKSQSLEIKEEKEEEQKNSEEKCFSEETLLPSNEPSSDLQNKITKIIEEAQKLLAQTSTQIPEFDIQIQTIKGKIAQILVNIQKLIKYNPHKDLQIYENLLMLQNHKTEIALEWKKLMKNNSGDKIQLLNQITEGKNLKNLILRKIAEKLNAQEYASSRNWIKTLVLLQKFHCILKNLQQRLNFDQRDFYRENIYVSFLEQLNFVPAVNLRNNKDEELEKQIDLLLNLKMILDREDAGKIKDEAEILWEINNIDKLQTVSILELNQKIAQGLKIRKVLTTLFDLQKQRETCEEKQNVLIKTLKGENQDKHNQKEEIAGGHPEETKEEHQTTQITTTETSEHHEGHQDHDQNENTKEFSKNHQGTRIEIENKDENYRNIEENKQNKNVEDKTEKDKQNEESEDHQEQTEQNNRSEDYKNEEETIRDTPQEQTKSVEEKDEVTDDQNGNEEQTNRSIAQDDQTQQNHANREENVQDQQFNGDDEDDHQVQDGNQEDKPDEDEQNSDNKQQNDEDQVNKSIITEQNHGDGEDNHHAKGMEQTGDDQIEQNNDDKKQNDEDLQPNEDDQTNGSVTTEQPHTNEEQANVDEKYNRPRNYQTEQNRGYTAQNSDGEENDQLGKNGQESVESGQTTKSYWR